jgi:exodeoxyribonuclease VII large subunit
LLQRDARSLAQVGVRLRSPRQQLDLAGRQLRDSTRALGVAYRNLVTATDRRLAATSQLLESVSYKRVLDRGYAVVRDADGQALTRRAGIDPDTAAQVEFQDGSVAAVLDPQGAARPAKRSAKPAKPAKADQGRLL